MSHTNRFRLPFGLLILMLLISGNIAVYLWDPPPLQLLRHNTFDHFQRLKPRDYQDTAVRIIDINDASLQRIGQWPWPRTQVATLIEKLQSAGPSAIGLDIIFAEKDRTSPGMMQKIWELTEDEQQILAQLPDHDQVLAEAIHKAPTILAFAMTQGPKSAYPPIGKAHFVKVDEPTLLHLPNFNGAVTSLPKLESAAQGNGALTFLSDADGVIRRVPAIFRYQDKILPSLVMESLRLAEGAKNYLLRSTGEPSRQLADIQVGKLHIPVTEKGEMWLYYSKAANVRYISAWQVMQGLIESDQLKDKILLIGSSAPGLMDLRYSPLGRIIPGIEVHAQALEQILSGAALQQPAWHEAAEVLFILVSGLLLGAFVLNSRIAPSVIVFIFSVTALWAATWHAFTEYRYLLDPMVPSVMLLSVFLCTSIFRHLYSEHRQRWIKEAFSHYISPNLVDYLISHPQELELGGHRRTCSFVFTDLVNFTPLIESLDPGEAVNLLNDYIENMIAIAFSYQGTLDRIVGDAVVIMFSAPVKQDDHQRRAIQCAMEMQRFASRYSRELNKIGIAFGHTRIGVHTGEVIVGNFGGKTIFDYRALGDPVNTAARLESANQHLGTLICVSEATLSACPDIPKRPIGRVLLKGKSIPLQVFEPLFTESIDHAALAEYQDAYTQMCNGQAQAIEAFQEILWKHPNDKLAAFHLKRLADGAKDDLIELNRK